MPADPEVVTLATLRGWTLPAPGDGKESRGRVLVIGGSRSSPGAVRLAGEAALRAGAGKLRIATVGSVTAVLGVGASGVGDRPTHRDGGGTCGPSGRARRGRRVRAGRRGPRRSGPHRQGRDRRARQRRPRRDRHTGRDRRARIGVPDRRPRRHPASPGQGSPHSEHPGARQDRRVLRGGRPSRRDRRVVAARVAARSGVVVLHGGTDKHIVTPDGRAWVIRGGGPGLGVSGSGDVQAGLVTGLLARGAEPRRPPLGCVPARPGG